MDEALILAAATDIQNYLASRPDSADTLEGIHQCWIEWSGIPESINVTAAALERLETAGFVEHVQVRDRQIWRRRHQKREQ
jgi:hypothetical protein